MKVIILPLLFISLTINSFAQIYQSTEVDKAAEPVGGKEIFDLFIAANLRVPLTLASKSSDQEVLITATVEVDGSTSDLKILKGVDSLCNAEAMRVINLFKAWKPALLKAVPVRQAVTIPVGFKTELRMDYDPDQKALLTYFDKNRSESYNIEKSKYRRRIPVDVFGIVNGNVVYQEKNGDEWKDVSIVKVEKEEFWEKIYESRIVDSVKAIRINISLQEKETIWKQIAVLQQNGSLLSLQQFASKKNPIRNYYYLNGLLKELRASQNEMVEVTGWHNNGQLATIVLIPPVYKNPFIYVITDVRERNGDQQVINGNGYVCFPSETYTVQGIDGCGAVKNGHKQGIWKNGNNLDTGTENTKKGALYFEENYEDGILIKGTSFADGKKYEYTEVEAQPQFSGGFSEMYKYLGRNTKYPKDAAKLGVQGKVYTSFVVGVDGSVEDVKVEKGLYPSLDEEALRVIRGMNGQWMPGIQRGRKVRVKYALPIIFGLY
ncbi:energy transducer TonB [Dyadobacter sp. CY356]|uniref:energy transducer TonB n=1 Tax=Dyadobacter sp. CY356 TaxID=2906442 RepID=UPI001F2D066B|nr:energy transducer TonB [Dyadobacter sp. CY356]MCF0059503.1 energy transducer TonB [Dyadobacter sp. CY356]